MFSTLVFRGHANSKVESRASPVMTENHDFDMSHPALSRTTVQPGPGSAVHYKNSVYLLHSVELGVFSQFTGSPALL